MRQTVPYLLIKITTQLRKVGTSLTHPKLNLKARPHDQAGRRGANRCTGFATLPLLQPTHMSKQ